MKPFLSSFLRIAFALGLLAPALSPIAVRAGDCGADPVYAKNAIGVPTVGLRVRDIACMEGSVVLTTVAAGTEVQIIGETDGWYKVKVGDVTGWMGASLMRVTSEGTVKAAKEPQAKITIDKKIVVGILEKDFEKIAKDKALQKRLKEKVLLRVQKKGETWYMEKDGTLSRVKMYGKSEFKRIKTVTEEKKEKVEAKTPFTITQDELALAVKTLPGAASLTWTKRTTDGFNGYKIVRSSTNEDPSYPNDGYVEYIPDRDTLSFIDGTAIPGKTYYYRICAREKEGPATCGNVVKVVARQR